MGISAEIYYDAAREHAVVAAEMYDLGRYVLAHYVSGLSVECILRAYQARRSSEFDSKHDLRRLSHEAKFPDLFPAGQESEWEALFADLARRWNNDFRFRSLKSLRRYLRRAGLHEGIKGDFVKESARRIVSAAAKLVELGVSKWKP